MISDEDKLKADLYWKMYNEHATQARHHETVRGTVSTILVAVSAGVLSVFNSEKHGGSKAALYVGLMLIALGVLGILISYKHYERNRLHSKVLGEFREALDALFSSSFVSLGAINERGRAKHASEYPFSSKYLRVHYLWVAVFIFIVVLGVEILRLAN